MKDAKIYFGDCKDKLEQLCADGVQVDLTVTSPPYDNLRTYKGSCEWSFDVFKSIANQLVRITKQGGVIVWVVSDSVIDGSETCSSFKQVLYFRELGMDLYDTMIWLKPSPQAPTEGRYYDVFEYMFIFSKGKPKCLNLLADRKNKSAGMVSKKESRSCKEDRKTTDATRVVKDFSRRFNVWEISRGHSTTEHPAVMPDRLAYDHILSWSNEQDLVLDPFMGSGTTGLMALKANRRFIGIEKEKTYFELSKRRIEQAKLTLF